MRENPVELIKFHIFSPIVLFERTKASDCSSLVERDIVNGSNDSLNSGTKAWCFQIPTLDSSVFLFTLPILSMILWSSWLPFGNQQYQQ